MTEVTMDRWIENLCRIIDRQADETEAKDRGPYTFEPDFVLHIDPAREIAKRCRALEGIPRPERLGGLLEAVKFFEAQWCGQDSCDEAEQRVLETFRALMEEA